MNSISQRSKSNNPESKQSLRRFTVIDLFIILLLIAGTIATLPAMKTITPDTVIIYRDNTKIATYPLKENREVTVEGYRGPVTIIIKNGAVAVKEVNCPHGICKKTGFINNPHAQIICAPNHLLITVSSTSEDTLDAIVR